MLASALLVPAGADPLPGPSADDAAAFLDKARAAVVKVQSGDGAFTLAGSGFFIDANGTVLTAATLVGGSGPASVTVNGVDLEAQVLARDPRSGLAMLRVHYDASPSLVLGHSGDLKTGYPVVTIGYPLNLPLATGQGLVSGFDIHYLNRFFATTHIHADIGIAPGQVGGPLLNARGEVVGLVVASPDQGRSLYALPVEAMQKIIADFNQYGRARHGWVGVDVMERPDLRQDGRTVCVLRLAPGAPASASGMRPGDTILRIDSREIYRPADVMDASFFSHVGGTMNVVVRRDADLLTYAFPVIERPAAPAGGEPARAASLAEPVMTSQRAKPQ